MNIDKVALDPIFVIHTRCDSLNCGFLLPSSEDGWNPEIQYPNESGTGRKVSPIIFCTERLFQQPTKFITILHARRVFSRYLLEYYSTVHSVICLLILEKVKMKLIHANRLVVLSILHVSRKQTIHETTDEQRQSNIQQNLLYEYFLTITCDLIWPDI